MMRLEELSWPQVEELPKETTALVMVLGPIEQHGPHLPLGTDIYVAQEMVNRMVPICEEEGWTVVEVPPVYYVPAVLSRKYPGSVSVRKHHFGLYLEDIMVSHAETGFINGILISTHIDPPFVTTTQDVLAQINARYGTRFIHGYERFPMEDVMSGLAPKLFGYHMDGDVHAGVLETSSMSIARPDLVNWNVAGILDDQPVEFEELAESRSFRDVGNGLGYTGYPRLADRRFGEVWYSRYGQKFGDVLRDYCHGQDVAERLSITHLL